MCDQHAAKATLDVNLQGNDEESAFKFSHQTRCTEQVHLLGGLEVSMDDFVEVEVVHATRDAHGPVNQEGGGDFTARPQHLIQLALSAVFH